MSADEGYSVARSHGCRVVRGWIPVIDLVALTNAWCKDDCRDDEDGAGDAGDIWIVDARLSQALDASFVAGPKSACLAWRAELGLGE